MLSRAFCARARVLGWRGFHSGEFVTAETVDRVTTITLNAPKTLNALTAAMGDEFRHVVHTLSYEAEDTGAVVLRGAGKAFSAGGDLDFLRSRAKDSPSRNSVLMHRFYHRFLSVRSLPVPVVAAITGPAIGAGMCLATACDVRVASARARLGFTFSRLGLHPGMGSTHFLPQLVGPEHAARLLLTGDTITGLEAKEIGLVSEVVQVEDDQDSIEATVARATEVAQRMASAAPIAVRSAVRSLRMRQEDGLEKALWREADAQSYSYASTDLSDGIEAVAQKKNPNFQNFETYTE